MQDIGVYIHWPYCARLCPYCDFNIYKHKQGSQDALVEALLTDMQYWRELSGKRALTSIHFGGGTPSLLRRQNLAKCIDQALTLWTPAKDMEIAIEANPNDITKQSLLGWRKMGVERLSIGVQSFNDKALRLLGRDHDGAQAQQALNMALEAIPRVSADLIYGWAGQTAKDWHDDLATVLGIGLSHISTYQLTIEPGTAFGRAQKRGHEKAVHTDKSADLFEQAIHMLRKAGFDHYEISNFAKTAQARSRHNLLYWQGGDYAGIGPGAHGRMTNKGGRIATIAAYKPADYIHAVQQKNHGLIERETLDPQAWGDEYVLMGLRIQEGISLARYAHITGQNLPEHLIQKFARAGLVKLENDRLSASEKGRLVLDTLIRELLSA